MSIIFAEPRAGVGCSRHLPLCCQLVSLQCRSVLPDVFTHGRIFLRVLTFPPLKIMEVAAERARRGFGDSDSDTLSKSLAAFAARTSTHVLRFHCTMPGNSTVSCFVETGRIDGADWFARARMPVLAVGPMVDKHDHAANLAVWRLVATRRGISPDAPVAAIEAARAAVVGTSVGHLTPFHHRLRMRTQRSLTCIRRFPLRDLSPLCLVQPLQPVSFLLIEHHSFL